jgi:hypothetical protein
MQEIHTSGKNTMSKDTGRNNLINNLLGEVRVRLAKDGNKDFEEDLRDLLKRHPRRDTSISLG